MNDLRKEIYGQTAKLIQKLLCEKIDEAVDKEIPITFELIKANLDDLSKQMVEEVLFKVDLEEIFHHVDVATQGEFVKSITKNVNMN